MSLHKSVLLQEAIDSLDLREGDLYLDATVGSGGHMQYVWEKFGNKVTLLGIDVDSMSISIAKEKMELLGVKPHFIRLNFRNIDKVLEEIENSKKPNKILFDLVWSSDQFEEGGRGFYFNKDEPLVMTLNKDVSEEDVTAYDVVNAWAEESLVDVIYGYGEERFSRRIAKAIVESRKSGPINSSRQLSEIIKQSVPFFYRFGKIHPATRTFQAIRIAVNDELQALEEGLLKAIDMLPSGGRLAVITFHSLEDRIVKNIFNNKKDEGVVEIFNKKPIIPTEEEIQINKRARSAKLRVIIKK